MNKLISILATLALLLTSTSCSSDDNEGPSRDHDITASFSMLNHVYDQSAKQAGPLTTEETSFTLHRAAIDKMNVDLTLRVTVAKGDTRNIKLTGVPVKYDEATGRYTINAVTTADNSISDLNGTIDFNESAMLLDYTVDGHYRVMATQPQVFYTKSNSVLTYSDNTSFADNAAVYQFDIDPKTMTATFTLGGLLVSQIDTKFTTIKSEGIKITVTQDGYTLAADKPKTISKYKHGETFTDGPVEATQWRCTKCGHVFDDPIKPTACTSCNNPEATFVRVDQLFPITGFQATISLKDHTHNTTFTMGDALQGINPFKVNAHGNVY